MTNNTNGVVLIVMAPRPTIEPWLGLCAPAEDREGLTVLAECVPTLRPDLGPGEVVMMDEAAWDAFVDEWNDSTNEPSEIADPDSMFKPGSPLAKAVFVAGWGESYDTLGGVECVTDMAPPPGAFLFTRDVESEFHVALIAAVKRWREKNAAAVEG